MKQRNDITELLIQLNGNYMSQYTAKIEKCSIKTALERIYNENVNKKGEYLQARVDPSYLFSTPEHLPAIIRSVKIISSNSVVFCSSTSSRTALHSDPNFLIMIMKN